MPTNATTDRERRTAERLVRSASKLAGDRRAAERLIKAAGKLAVVENAVGRMSGRRGILSDAIVARQDKAEAAFAAASDALLARLADPAS